MIKTLSNQGYDYLQQQLIKHEGLRQFPYTCTAGKLTIGIGRNIQDTGISKDEAFYLLNNDITRCEAELIANFPEYNDLCEMRKIVLLNMCFNVGIHGLLAFRKMIAALRTFNYREAANEIIDSQLPENRKHDLAYLMEKGSA